MKKMPCLFERDFHGPNRATLKETLTPECAWVLAGEGVASIKRDGTACMFQNNQLFKRYDAKKDRKTGEFRMPPPGSIPCDEPDPVTGHWPHWVLIGETDYWHAEAFKRQASELVDGTYELCGPKISANPENLTEHRLIQHGTEVFRVTLPPLHGQDLETRSHGMFYMLKDLLSSLPHEGIVFAHPDGRFAKIRRKDYGLKWPLDWRGGVLT